MLEVLDYYKMGKNKKVACPSCGVMKRSNNLIRHLRDPKGHAMTHEQALELRNSLKSENRVRARKPQSQEPALAKKPRIEAVSTRMSYQIDSVTAPKSWNIIDEIGAEG